MIEKNLTSTADIRNQTSSSKQRQAIVEIGSGDGTKRIIVPYSRWKDIERWFYDTEINSDYVFDIDNSGESHTIFRISRATQEIRLIDLSKLKLFAKSLEYIFLSNIPALISFVTALILVAFIWVFSAVNSLLNHEKVTLELMEPARSGTFNITLFFIFVYLIVFLIKTFRILQDRYYAVREDFEVSIMSSLAFNSFFVALIGFLGVEGILDIIKSLLA